MTDGESFGKFFRMTTYGESHGDAVGVIIEGFPPGFKISLEDLQLELDRRRPGRGPTVSGRNEPDKFELLAGIVDGKTTGEPIRLQVRNKDARPSDYDLSLPRPGHADMTYFQKYGKITPGGGRSSARETVGRVLAGALAKQYLSHSGIQIHGRILEIGGRADNFDETILAASEEGDSVGGIVEITATGVPSGLGEPVFNKLDADIAKAMLSIGAVKGVEFGAGFGAAILKGSENNDPIIVKDEKLATRTNNAGGILGGISNGMPIVCRMAVKPTSSIGKEQDTVDLGTMQPAKVTVRGRHDPCICQRMVPVAEAMMAVVLLDHFLRAGKGKSALESLRARVGSLDADLVRVIKARMGVTGEIAPVKRGLGMPVYDPVTERLVIERARRQALDCGLSADMVETIVRAIMAESRLSQEGGPQQVNESMSSSRFLPPPGEFRAAVPLSNAAACTVASTRNAIRAILEGLDDRILLMVGPCSIHDVEAAEELAGQLARLSERVGDRFLLVMRAYVEKSRSGAGWTGFITDPRLDGSGDVQEGITLTRKLLNRLGELGVPVAVEFINPLVASYIGDLVSWASVGARSSGSQIHRDMASGLPMPVGFKNGVDGSIGHAIGAVESARVGHDFIGLGESGGIAAFKTGGNLHCHIVLRGGDSTNYDGASIKKAQDALSAAGLPRRLMVDCGHGNSGKVAANQIAVFENVIGQIAAGNRDIVGLMLESNLRPGRQDMGGDPDELEYGVSVTDECLGWEEMEALVLEGFDRLLS